MGQCQQCQQTLLTNASNCANAGKAAQDDSDGEDFIVGKDAGVRSNNNQDGLLAIWKWDEQPGQDKPRGYKDFETDSPWARKDRNNTATLALARHLLFNPHLRYKFGSCYRTERKIGAGTYGDVYEAVALPSQPHIQPVAEGSERRVAVKSFVVEAQLEEPDRQKLVEFARRRASFEAERSVLAQIEHPHIVKMHECFEEKGYLYIVLELCRGGELYERIAQKVISQGGRGFEESVACHLFRQMLYAVGYLHANRVVHRDLKTENFLLLGEIGTDDADVLKLCDFGTAVRLSPQRPRSNGRVGTLSYMAPEVYANRGADICADIWSLGVVLYLILVGANPFRNSQTKTKVATVRKIESGDFDQGRVAWLDLTDDARNLIKALLVLEEEKRLTCVQALHHVWVDGPNSGPNGVPKNGMPKAVLTPRTGSSKDPAAHAASVLVLLMRFSGLDPMQKLALAACSQTTFDKDLCVGPSPIPWYQLFVMLDADGDGRLSFEEFASGFKAMLGSDSVPDEKLFTLARALDTDGSGSIEWGEWLAVGLLTLENLASAPEPLTTAFRLLDRPTGDGTVGAADLLAVIDGGTSGNDSRVPAEAARAEVLEALSKWQPKKADAGELSGVAMLAPPSLVEDDMRRVVATIAGKRQDRDGI